MCFVPPLVSVAQQGQKAGDFGGRRWGGDGHPWLPVGPLTSTQSLGMDGRRVMPTYGLEGKGAAGGLWGGLEFSLERSNKEVPQIPHNVSYTHLSGG